MTSPFKFLDPYGRADRSVFFGRDRAIEDLYTLVLQTKLVLVYGMSGTGKTSIIQCGLGAKFRDSDWLPLLIRRKDDINAATLAALAAAGRTPLPPGADVVTAARSVYLDTLRPIFLMFDQFEELFILGSEAERATFFATVETLLASDLSFKIIIILREEYVAQLSSYEAAVPTLFEKRLRIEPMTPLFVKDVFNKTTAAFGIELEYPVAVPPHPSTADAVIAQLADKNGLVELAYLQVYLDRLYRSADPGPPMRFTDALITATGAIGDVMVKFLEEQVAAIKKTMAASHPELGPNAIEAILGEFVTAEGTKQPLSLADLARRPLDLTPKTATPQGWRKWLLWWRPKPTAQPVDVPAVVAEVTPLLETARILRLSGGQYELAHDCLAARVAEFRSADRSAELGVEKLVRDVLFQFHSGGRKKTYLNRDQLIEIRRFSGRLDLDPDQLSFVEASRRHLRHRRVAIWAAAVVALSGAFLWLGYSLDAADTKHADLVAKFTKIAEEELLPEQRLKIFLALFDDDTSKPIDSYNIAEKYIELGEYSKASKRLDEMSTRIADNSGADDSDWWNYLYHFARGNVALGENKPTIAVDELMTAVKEAKIDVTSPNHPPITSGFIGDPNQAEYLAAGLCQLAAAQHLTGNTSAATRTIELASAVRAPLNHLQSHDNDKIFDRCDQLTDTLTASRSPPPP